MKVVNGREIPNYPGELTSQEGVNMLADLLGECANALSDTPDADNLSPTTLTVSGNATVGGTLDVTGATSTGALTATSVASATIDRSGAIAIGGTSGTTVTIGRTGQSLSLPGTVTATNALRTGANNGAANGTGVVATELGDGSLHQTVLTLTAHSVTIDGTAVGFGTSKIYDFPEGALCILGAVVNLAITAGAGGIADDFDGDFALGTAGTADGDFGDAGEANIIASTATPQAAAGVSSAKGQSTGTEAPVYLDGTTTAADLYLNFLIDDADISSNDTLACTGTVTITWVKLGDY